jgi:hypothetical protein
MRVEALEMTTTLDFIFIGDGSVSTVPQTSNLSYLGKCFRRSARDDNNTVLISHF